MANGKVTLAELPCSMWGRHSCDCDADQVFRCIYTGFAFGPPRERDDDNAQPDGAREGGVMESFDLEGLNCDGLGAPPTITFSFADANTRLVASPPGASITIDAWSAAEGAEPTKSRIRIVDTDADAMVLDIIASHIHEPRWPEWTNASLYASEVAAAFYWAMWRRSELRKREASAQE